GSNSSQTQVHDVELFFNTVLNRVDELADLSARKQLASMQFRLRRETSDSLSVSSKSERNAGFLFGSDDNSSCVRSVRHGILCPRRPIVFLVREIGPESDLLEIDMRRRDA